MLHCGWRGLSGGIVAAGVAALRGLGAGGELQAVIGPGAGGCCYETGDEVRELFAAYGAATGRLLDLKAVAATQLRDAGVAVVADVGRCTICDERYFSHRREGADTGRQGGFAWLR
jgi:copper oxidase (laccase) domain-containing protein